MNSEVHGLILVDGVDECCVGIWSMLSNRCQRILSSCRILGGFSSWVSQDIQCVLVNKGMG